MGPLTTTAEERLAVGSPTPNKGIRRAFSYQERSEGTGLGTLTKETERRATTYGVRGRVDAAKGRGSDTKSTLGEGLTRGRGSLDPTKSGTCGEGDPPREGVGRERTGPQEGRGHSCA